MSRIFGKDYGTLVAFRTWSDDYDYLVETAKARRIKKQVFFREIFREKAKELRDIELSYLGDE